MKKNLKIKMFYLKLKMFVMVQDLKMKYTMFRYSTIPNLKDKLKGRNHSPIELLNMKAIKDNFNK